MEAVYFMPPKPKERPGYKTKRKRRKIAERMKSSYAAAKCCKRVSLNIVTLVQYSRTKRI